MLSKEYLHAERNQPWREALRKTMKNKERTDLPRVKMPEQPPEIRIHNFQEVNLGLTPELALAESHRCLDCVNPTCIMAVSYTHLDVYKRQR